ncbi:hypothetical protein MK489_25115, partial [Myxococcota bacterium]|nr:hypothetical protein [Myxococcota bacterium]
MTKATDARGGETRYAYDAVGNVSSTTDANLHETRYVYDALNRIVQEIDPYDKAKGYEYDAVGNLTTEIDRNGNVTTYEYDLENRVASRTGGVGNKASLDPALTPDERRDVLDQDTVLYVYDSVGNRTLERDEDGRIRRYAYDKNNRRTSEIRGEGDPFPASEVKYKFDKVGNLIAETDQNNNENRFSYDANNRITQRIDPIATNLARILAYDDVGNLISETDEAGGKTSFTYDKDDQLLSKTTPIGNKLAESDDAIYIEERRRRGYADSSGSGLLVAHLTSQQKADLREIYTENYAYDVFGNMVSVVDENGYRTTYQYDQLNRRDAETSAVGHQKADAVPQGPARDAILTAHTKRWGYDSVGNLTIETDELGNSRILKYDANNRKVAQFARDRFLEVLAYDDEGNQIEYRLYAKKFGIPTDDTAPTPDVSDLYYATTFGFDANNRKIVEVDPTGLKTIFEYDGAGNQTRETKAPGTGDSKHREQYFDDQGRLYKMTDWAGVETFFELDPKGQVLKRRDAFSLPNERSTSFEYDANGRLTKQTDPLGNALVQSDPPLHLDIRLQLGVTNASGEGKSLDELSDDEKRLLKDLYSTAFEYTPIGDLDKKTRSPNTPRARLEVFEWDANSRLVKQVNGAGDIIEFEYDPANNKTREVASPDKSEKRELAYFYDADGQLTESRDGNGNTTLHVYDAKGQKIETRQASGTADERRTLFEYDGDESLTRVVSPLGTARTYSNEPEFIAWRQSQTDPLGGVYYERWEEGVRSDQVDRILNDHSTRYQYDSYGNQAEITDANGVKTVNVFDQNGRLETNLVAVTAEKVGIQTDNRYDVFGNIVETTQSFSDGSDARSTNYKYDSMNRVIQISDGNGFSTLFEYDEFGNQVKITHGAYLPKQGDAEYSYEKDNVVNEIITNFEYDENNQLVRTVDGNGNSTRCSWDQRGNKVSETTGITGGNDQDHTSTKRFVFDHADRLTQSITGEGSSERIEYDTVGNRKSVSFLQSGNVNEQSAEWLRNDYTYDKNG